MFFSEGELCVDDCYPEHKLSDLIKQTKKPSIRLINGTRNHEGFVEIFRDGQWHPLTLGRFEANIVCQELGFMWMTHYDDKILNDDGKEMAS